jgi:uncharacterized protein (DUF608 family)
MPRSIWPVIKTYEEENLRKISMPVGGIGTGSIGLGGNGALINWEIRNRPEFGFIPDICAFLVRVEQEDKPIFVKVLEGPLDDSLFQGPFGSQIRNHGMPRFRKATFKSSFPLGRVELEDPKCPVSISLEGFNPLIPTDIESSSLPMMMYRCIVSNPSKVPATVSVSGNLSNFLSPMGTEKGSFLNINEYKVNKTNVLIKFSSEQLDKLDENFGNFSLGILNPIDPSHRTSWADLTWRDALLEMWQDFEADGRLESRKSITANPIGSLCDKRVIEPGSSEEFIFIISWYFPNRTAWSIEGEDGASQYPGTNIGKYTDLVIGNHYTNRFDDSTDVVDLMGLNLDSLEERSRNFLKVLTDSSLPENLLDAAVSNLSTLKTQTFFRTPDGKFFGWEGIGDKAGACFGNCTHVWNYEQTTPFLFGDIAKDMRETEFLYATDVTGFMRFRVTFPLSEIQTWPIAAADGQMGCIVKLYRDWTLSGDLDWLRSLWPKAKKALQFAWVPGGWDADQDGVMEGIQHNTMDIEYFGPNPQMGFWYLSALKAASEMAKELGDLPFSEKCLALFNSGSSWIDSNLFNGEFYEQIVRPITPGEFIAPGLRHGIMGAQNMQEPEFQLGKGCLVDQLIGQFLANISGLGPLAEPKNLKLASSSVLKFNRRSDIPDHFNHMRSYALGDEAGLIMASYPNGGSPARPFPYVSEMMTGFEYSAAGNLIYAGLDNDAIRVINDVRARYNGKNRNPFDESECGRHYSRAMIAWGLVIAWYGQNYNARNGILSFDNESRGNVLPWFTGYAWGKIEREKNTLIFDVIEGQIYVEQVIINKIKYANLSPNKLLRSGNQLIYTMLD